MLKKHLRCAVLLLMAAVFFASCGNTHEYKKASSDISQDKQEKGSYAAPPFADSVYNAEAATGENGALVDFSNASKGYIAVSAKNEKRIKVKLIKNDFSYEFNLPNDGSFAVYPLAMGDGSYEVKIFQNTREDYYIPIYSITQNVELNSEFEPFVRPSQYSAYTQSDECVIKAAELAKNCSTDAELASEIYKYIKENIKYDKEKAEKILAREITTYLPEPDETFTTEKGICFDYASLAAAMLRSQGIPTKIITGNVAPNDLSHAWNMIWLKDKGWITVELKMSSKNWGRIDLTFAAGGAGSKFVGDGSNYTDMYVY